MKVEVGDTVKLEYTGKYETGEVFDTSDEKIAKEAGIYRSDRDYEPLEVKAGTGQVIKGLDNALIGMKKGEEKKVTVPPEEGYGSERPELIQKLPAAAFKQSGISPEVGMRINTTMGIAQITNIFEDEIEVNFNHPLAGKTIVFDIKVKDITKP
jgi:FKBP-type peptidyl-prolyl cis-trans isomerase 2